MKPKHQKPLIAMALAAIAFTMTSANAAVTFVGSLTNDIGNQISSWSSTAVNKTLDIDGNNYYGSDGYTWMNNLNDSGNGHSALQSIVQSTPSYTGGIAYTGAGASFSGSWNGADDRLLPDGTGSNNVGYAGVNYPGTPGAQQTLQQLFAYTMNRNMNVGETIRVSVVLDSLGDPNIGATSLSLFAGANSAAATIAGNGTSVMDMYFFDVTGLTSGQQIQIWGANSNVGNDTFRAVTIGGVTFDSIPEPGAALLGGLGMLALLRRRRN